MRLRSGASFRFKLLRLIAGTARRLRWGKEDRLLSLRLRRALEQSLSDDAGTLVQIYVMDGIVTVYGSVRSELDRDLLLAAIRAVPGTRKVVGHLQVQEANS